MNKKNKFGFDLNEYAPQGEAPLNKFKLNSDIPKKMRDSKRWLLWRSEKDNKNPNKFRKVPYYIDGTFRRGTLDTPEDLERLGSYDQAVDALSNGDFSGLGFALGKDGEGYWQGIDLDKIKQHGNDKLAESLPGYVELSPSGNGVHAIGYGDYFRNRNNSTEGFEYYCRVKFFTFSGNIFKNEPIIDLKPFIKQHIDENLIDEEFERTYSLGQLILSDSQIDDVRRALKYIDPDCPRDKWIEICFSLARVPEGFDLFRDWSLRSSGKNHSVATEIEIEDQWNDIYTNTRGAISLGTLYYHASQDKDFHFTEVSETVKDLSANRGDPLIIDVDQWSGKMIAPDWVIDNFIGEGIRSIAGAAGKGKTSIMAPLCAHVAHLLEPSFVTPRHRRVVFYFTEDTNQVNKMVMGMKMHQSREFSSNEEKEAEWRKYFQIKLTQRYSVKDIQKLAEVIKDYTTEQDGKIVPPLVVFDTQAASLDIEDENNNAQLSEFISTIKRYFWETHRIPVFIVTHITKNSSADSDYLNLSSRGAGAITGDCHGTMGIVQPAGLESRVLGNIKDRDGASRKEIMAKIHSHKIEGLTPYGESILIDYFTTEFSESSPVDRKELIADSGEMRKYEKIIDAIRKLNSIGEPTTARKIRDLTNIDNTALTNLLIDLTSQGKIERIVFGPDELKARGLHHKQNEIYKLKGDWEFIG